MQAMVVATLVEEDSSLNSTFSKFGVLTHPLSVERNHKKKKLIHAFKQSDAEYYKIRMRYVCSL